MSLLRRLLTPVAAIAGTMSAWSDLSAAEGSSMQVTSPLAFTLTANDGKPYALSQHQGQVVMIVNTASNCGFTRQYAGLERLYKKYHAQGFVIIGIPANDFMHQEPGTDAEIATFCQKNYGVTFPLMAKVEVTGSTKIPLYTYLTEKSSQSGGIKWNFTKFLIGRDGQIINRFGPSVDPEKDEVVTNIESALAAPAPAAIPTTPAKP